MRQKVQTALGFLMLGVVLFSFAWAMMEPRKATTVAKAMSTGTETRLDKEYSEMSPGTPSSDFIKASPSKIAAVKAEKKKNREELARLMKISKPIPLIIPGESMSISANKKYNGIESIFSLDGIYTITGVKAKNFMEGKPEVILTLLLSPDDKGEKWIVVATSHDVHSDMPVERATIAKRAKWRIETGFHPALYGEGKISTSSLALMGVKSK